jgi:hypothetical protein
MGVRGGSRRALRNAAGAGAAIAVTVAVVIGAAGPAGAANVPGTATLNSGTLNFNAPASVAFSASLTGSDQVVNATQALDVLDNTGSGAGWNITLTTTTFVNGSNALPTTAVSDTGATGACDPGVTCTLANNTLSYPILVPAAATAPTAVKILSAAAGTGMSGQTWTHTMALTVPANARAGQYTSTWTYSLVSGP